MISAQRALPIQNPEHQWTRVTRGQPGAPIAVVCDPPDKLAVQQGLPMRYEALKWFASKAKALGFERGDIRFYSLCPPIHDKDVDSASRKWKHVEQYSEGLADQIIADNPQVIVTLGELATRVMVGRAVAITKARGKAIVKEGCPPVIPFLSPSFVLRIPDHMPTFEADLNNLKRLADGRYDLSTIAPQDVDYRWVSDISHILSGPRKPRVVAIDTETTGLTWWRGVRVLTLQITYKPGQAYVLPMSQDYIDRHRAYFAEHLPAILEPGALDRLRAQAGTLLRDPDIKKMGHNLKYEHQMCLNEVVGNAGAIDIKGWMHDTQLMAFFADENMMDKALDTCVRTFVPEMGGYSDEFDRTVNKADMVAVDPAKMLPYAGGDTDATYRLAKALDPLLRRDPRQWNCYRKVQYNALLCFAKVAERYGIMINQENLESLGKEVEAHVRTLYRKLMRSVPAAIKREAISKGQQITFTPNQLRDILFSKKGFNLKPVKFTKTTEKLDKADRVASTSAKQHLPFFVERQDAAGQFCRDLTEWIKSEKLLNTYIGDKQTGNGFWQYIAPDGAIYPSYKLHAVVTGRTASDNPNGQNFPKRGTFAKAYNRIFMPRPGYRFISADLSQIELRIAAWMAGDTTMINLYRANGDIHTATAIASMAISDAAWAALPAGDRKLNRTKAKAVNFGFLYGMGHKGFKDYAKTDYGVDYTEQEALTARTRFFTKYNKLEAWHQATEEFAKRHGYVRALHGAIRHLPGVNSIDRGIVAGAIRQAINSPVQRFGSDLGLMGMIRFSHQADPDKMRIVAFIHDALVMEVKIGWEVEAMQALLYSMENPPLQEWFGLEPPLPIKAEADIGMNFGQMIEMAELPTDKATGNPALPEWFSGVGLPAPIFEDGKWSIPIKGEKPVWWNDDEKAAERHFLYEMETHR